MSKFLILVLSFFLPIQYSYSYNLDLPEISGYPGTPMEQSEENAIGKQVISLLHQQLGFINDPLVINYLNALAKKLSHYFFYQDNHLNIYLVNSQTINAFTLPGGHIVINSAIFDTANTEDELAAVLAHEIAHATQFHLKKTSDYNKNLQVSTMAAVLASAILTAYNPALGPGALAASLSLPQQAMVNFIRSNEKEADRIGIQALYRAGFDPFGMPTFLQALSDNQNPHNAKLEYLRTHPLTESRVADTISRADSYPYKQYPQNPNYYLAKARVQNITSLDPKKDIKKLKHQLATGLYQKKYATQYQLALAYNDINSPEALNIVRMLQDNFDKKNIYLDLLLVDYYEGQKDYAKALEEVAKLYETYPNHFFLAEKYALLALATKDPNLAINVINTSQTFNKNKSKAYKLLARSYDDLGDKVTAKKYNAEKLFHSGNRTLAVQQLESIIADEKLTAMNKSQIKARIKEIKAAS